MNSPPVDPADLRRRIESMTAHVRECEVRAARGEMIDLSRLDREVAEFCRDLGRADPESGMALTPLMAEMVGALESLAQTVKDQCAKSGITEH